MEMFNQCLKSMLHWNYELMTLLPNMMPQCLRMMNDLQCQNDVKTMTKNEGNLKRFDGTKFKANSHDYNAENHQ